MSVLSRGGLSMVRYILLAFDVVFVCLLFIVVVVVWGCGKEGVIYFSVCLLLVVFCLFISKE